MIIYTNENNPATVKLLIAQNFTNFHADLKIVNIHDRCLPQPKHLPCLQVQDGTIFFIPNAAVSYLYPIEAQNASVIHKWIEWEAVTLAPNLAFLQGTAVKHLTLKNEIQSALKKLDEHLCDKDYLVGNSVTNADIIIWSTLYPLSKNEESSKEFLSPLVNLTKWINKLENEKQFKDALTKFKVEPAAAYQALLTGAKYISTPERFEKKDSVNKEKDSPQRTVETVNSDEPHRAVETVILDELEKVKKAWEKSIGDLPKIKEAKEKVLPIKGQKNVFITSALPYVNNVPHLGNIIGCVLSADVFARFSRSCNYNTLYICGTDEYGTATETKALEEGLTCQAICDKYFKIHYDIYKWFNISFDYFGRTSTPEQTELCQDLFLELNNNGFMFTQPVEQLHCQNCNRFLADRFVEGGCPHIGCNYEDARGDQCDGCGKLVNAADLKNPRCKICGSTPKLKTSKQFFIDLPKLEPLLHHWMQKSSPGWSNNARVIAKSWLREGLLPRCITRDLKWGVPVPLDGFRDKVFYVWFDAPIGYMSISKAYSKEFKKWWQPEKETEVVLYQFMAKDNVPFHSVLFPAMLLGANRGYITVSHIMATEYLNYEDGKFSKSRGVGVFGNDAQNTGIPSDVWRFYLLYVRPESQDSSFCWDDLAIKANSELLNNLGNFINRALVFAKNNFNQTVPTMTLTDDDYTLLALCTREYREYVMALQKATLRDGIRHILAISKYGNQFMQSNQPWVLLKGSHEEKLRAGTIIGVCCNLTYLLATLLLPFLPETTTRLKQQLNVSDLVIVPENPEIINYLSAGHKLGEPSPLFTKIEPAQIEELKKKFGGSQKFKKDASGGDADVKSLEDKVAQQADKVRKLKSSAVQKSIWQPEVAVLLDLKKQLEQAQKKLVTAPTEPVEGSVIDPKVVQHLEDEISKQADKVRTLKSSGVQKSVWQPEVAVLLDLKKQLEEAQKKKVSASTAPVQGDVIDPKLVQNWENEISKQGLVVRKLKEGGAEKSVWLPEVEKLLTLKNQLAAALGTPLNNNQKGKKGKK